MRKLLVVTLIVLELLSAPGKTQAQADLRPDRFVLAPIDFPQPAEIFRSRIEDNAQATADQLARSGPKSLIAAGRITGYYMEAEQPNFDADGTPHPVVTAFLVSIFAARKQASQAFQQQRVGWDARLRKSPSVTKQGDTTGAQVGDSGSRALYRTVASSGAGSQVVAEMFFRTGKVLAEVWQYSSQADVSPYGSAAGSYLLSIARRLDNLARGPTVAPAVAFTLLSVRAEPSGAQPDYRLVNPPLRDVRVGHTLYLSAYVDIIRAPASMKARAAFSMIRHGTVRARYVLTQRLNAQPVGVYRFFIPYQFSRPGSVTVLVRLRLGTIVENARTMLWLQP